MVLYKKIKIINNLRKAKLPVVCTDFLRNLTGLKNVQSLASFVNSLIKLDVLEKAEKGKYLVRDNLGNDFLIANLLYKPSYVSLETALNLYGILSQFPMEITSITVKRRRIKEVNNKLYIYHHLKASLFWGYKKNNEALMALPEKALLDSIYYKSKGIKGINIDNLDLSNLSMSIFKKFSKRFPQTKVFKKLVKKALLKKE